MMTQAQEIIRLRERIRELEAAGRRIQCDPFGCRFCDSGKLRNPLKDHDRDCGFAMLNAIILPFKPS